MPAPDAARLPTKTGIAKSQKPTAQVCMDVEAMPTLYAMDPLCVEFVCHSTEVYMLCGALTVLGVFTGWFFGFEVGLRIGRRR